jgi:hypothetical protein
MTIRDLRKKFIFAAGDIQRAHSIGGFTWRPYDRLIDYQEAERAKNLVVSGYIGLHRNRGDLSNIAIPGMMKHAWIFEDDNIVEAVSEGVLKRHPFHALMSDYAIIVRPDLELKYIIEAGNRSEYMVGCPYDDRFQFDLDIEAALFADKATALDNMKQYGLGVSCSEMVALCYVGHRRELGLYRTKVGKRQVILPDAYLSTHFSVVWASKYTTVDNAHKLGLSEEGCEMLRSYWEDWINQGGKRA